ncbi:hypothetical protein BGZ99_003872 [Dissophora globulifera]|uniref:Uncharacterized protein n=1 Tax=Dissophora globulifera TaxID=979702 RepID=A0A9P6RLT6_9FUNG|nr:hypothetical protein BGZ99_003872 [Dissophora globulifera]
MTSATQAPAPDAGNPEDRIDAALAGHDATEDGYQSSDLDSSDIDSDADESSDDDSDSELARAGRRNKSMTIEQREKALIEIDAMDDDDEVAPTTTLYTANELVELPAVQKPQVHLGPSSKLEPIGSVMSIVDSVVVVQAASSGEVRVLAEGTVAAIKGAMVEGEPEQPEVLGEIFETFGPVARPLYSIRFNTASEIPAACTLGCTVYRVPEHSSFVWTEPLKALKGSDASNRYDEEVDDAEMEFSDDEKEMEHKRMVKQTNSRKRGIKERKGLGENSDASAASSRAPPTHRKPIALPPKPVRDESEDGYRILSRPGSLHQGPAEPRAPAETGTVPWYQQHHRELQSMMGTGQQPTITPEQRQQREQDSMMKFHQQQQIQQQLLQHQQQQQQMYEQQRQQQEIYQKQIQEAQATILRLQQQQHHLQQQQVPSLQPQAPQSSQQTPQQQQQQQIMDILSPLFPPSHHLNQPPQ